MTYRLSSIACFIKCKLDEPTFNYAIGVLQTKANRNKINRPDIRLIPYGFPGD